MSFSPLLTELIKALTCLPGVGNKSAQRMAMHLLEKAPDSAAHLAEILSMSLQKIGRCQQCRILSEQALCSICSDPRRQTSLLCVVETPMDVLALEAGGFRGRYFVLHGRLSPIDGIGPDQIGVDALQTLVEEAQVEEVILATNLTVEGEATAHFLHQRLQALDIRVTRIAHGVPMGGELEYVDGNTLSYALQGRKDYH